MVLFDKKEKCLIITDLGVPNPTSHGVCWSTSENPTTADSKDDKGAALATGAFTSSISSLIANTTYYVRSFVTNSAGTVYGEQMIFSTLIANDYTPVITANQSLDVDENAADNVSVGTVLAEDSDAVTSFTSWTITAGNEEGVFAIDATTGAITVDNNMKLDYETTTSYTLSITVSDGLNTSASEDVTIAINPINDNTPVITASQSFDIDENAADNASVGTVLASDGDAGTTFNNWMITGGNTDAIFAIDPGTGEITVEDNTNLDIESTTSYILSLTVSDVVNTSLVETVSVAVNDINDEIPVVTASQSFTVNETALNDANIGTVLVSDADAGTVFSGWTINSGNDDAVFAINSSTGEITVNDANELDYESTTSYNLAVTVSDGVNTSATEIVVVNVNDLNDNDPVVTASQSLTIAEDIANESAVGAALAKDDDAATSFSSWTETGGTGVSIFEINASTGAITVTDNTNLDYEATTSYTYTVTVSDGTNTSALETITIKITDENDVTPVVTASQTFNIDENAVNTASVETVLASDGDVTATTFSSWTITAGNTNSVFAINSSTGEITLNDANELDFEQMTSYKLSVTVSDGLNTSMVEDLVISLNNVNEVPSAIQLSNATIAENTANGTEIGTLTASDVDASQTFTYTIADIENFEIVGDKLVSKTAFNFETQNTYAAEITVTDQGGLTYKQSFSIQISDEYEAPIGISLSNASIAENLAIGTEVGTLTTDDVDASQTFTYTIADNENFEIVGDKLLSKAVFNFARMNSYIVEITVKDQENLSLKKAFTIQILNINESPTVIQLSNASIAENSKIGTEVGILRATDPDINQTFTFSLSENKYFEVDGDRIVSKEIFDFEDHISYSVKVIVTDQGELSYDDRFTLQIKDVNEAPEFLSDPLHDTQSGENYNYMIEYHDDDASGCKVTAFEIPSWLILKDNEDGTASLTGISTEAGIFNVILEASDNEYTTRQEFEIVVEAITGIEDVFTAPIVRIYPNPVARELYIDLSDFRNDETTISLLSMTGSLIFKEDYQNVGGKVKIIKSVQQLQSGVYLLLIESEGYRKSYKIVKQ